MKADAEALWLKLKRRGVKHIPPADLEFIRSLDDFDLTMFLLELDEHGLEMALALTPFIRSALEALAARDATKAEA